MGKLKGVARSGPLKSLGEGAPAVGMTLLHHLEIPYSSTGKAKYKGVTVNARRSSRQQRLNRLNLFARVPTWALSACRSSAEILALCGYGNAGTPTRLYCTVRSRIPNSQGLYLRVDLNRRVLEERMVRAHDDVPVATWSLDDLEARLAESHDGSVWVSATSYTHAGAEMFQYRSASYTASPDTGRLAELIEEGTVTVDHLIEKRAGATTEKGPLFKIDPANVSLLFGEPHLVDLLS